jgi:hypothetical protein
LKLIKDSEQAAAGAKSEEEAFEFELAELQELIEAEKQKNSQLH